MPNGSGKIKQLPPSEWFAAALDAKLEAEDMEGRPDPGWHHPSSLADPCMRYLQFKFIGFPHTNSSGAEMSFMSIVGTAVHKIVQSKMRDHERVFAIEGDLEDPVTRVRGNNDLRIRDWDGEIAVLDIKTVDRMPKDAAKYLVQLAWYCYLAGVKRAVVQAIGRGHGDKKRFEIPWMEMREEWEKSRDRAVAVTEMTVLEELAPRTPERRADCGKCVFHYGCDRAEKGDETWLTHRQQALSVMGITPMSDRSEVASPN